MTSNKNVIINGSCRVAQRSIGPKIIEHEKYSTVDCFKFFIDETTGTFISEQVEDAPESLSHSLKVQIKNACKKSQSDTRLTVQYLLDEQSLADFHYGEEAAQVFSLSFFAKSTKSGKFSLNIAKPENNRLEWTEAYVISEPDTWQYFSFKICPNNHVFNPGGSFGLGMGVGFLISFNLGFSEKAISPKLGEWIEGVNYWNVEDQVDLCREDNHSWQITGLQLELNEVSTSFELKSYKEELKQCMSYYTPINIVAEQHVSNEKKGLTYYQHLDSYSSSNSLIEALNSLNVLFSYTFWLSVKEIAGVNVSKQYRTSFLGVAWIIIPPVTMMAIYAVIIPTITGMDPQKFAIYLLSTLPVWQFLVTCITTPTTTLISSGDILKRCSISGIVFPVAELVKSTYTYIVSFIGMYLFCLALGLDISWHVVLLPLYIIPATISFFAIGIGLSFITPFVHDLKELVMVAMNILIWCSAVLYPITLLPESIQYLMEFNPLYIFMEPAINLISESKIPNTFVVLKLIIVMTVSIFLGLIMYSFGRRRFIYYI